MSAAFESLLWTYDLAGGWREGILHQKLTPAEVLSHCPTLKKNSYPVVYVFRCPCRRCPTYVGIGAHGGVSWRGGDQPCGSHRNHARPARQSEWAIVCADGREIQVNARVAIMATGVWLRDWNG
nr:hypothetical protein [Citrobacter sp. FDAARGOS_156]